MSADNDISSSSASDIDGGKPAVNLAGNPMPALVREVFTLDQMNEWFRYNELGGTRGARKVKAMIEALLELRVAIGLEAGGKEILKSANVAAKMKELAHSMKKGVDAYVLKSEHVAVSERGERM